MPTGGIRVGLPGRPPTSSTPSSPRPPQMPPMPQMPQMPSVPAPAPPPVSAPQIQVPQIQVPNIAVHQSQTDPNLTEYLNRVRTRLDNPGNDTRALNQAGQAVGEFAQGLRNNATGDALRRGVLGIAGAEGQISDDIGNISQGMFARSAENIALQRLRDEDALLMGAREAYVEPGRQGIMDRQVGVQAAGQQGQLQLAAGRMNLDAQMANQGAAQAANQMNYQAQLQAAQMAQAQQLAMAQIWANLYR